MRFICDTNELNTALSIVSRALAVRSTKPILEGILFESCDEGLRLTCTDLALTRIALTEAGDIQPKAEAVVSADD